MHEIFRSRYADVKDGQMIALIVFWRCGVEQRLCFEEYRDKAVEGA